MRFFRGMRAVACFAFLVAEVAGAQQIPLATLAKAELRSATAEVTTHDGARALKLNPKGPKDVGYAPGGPFVILDQIRFRNGAIDVDVAGAPAKVRRRMLVGLSAWRFVCRRTHGSKFCICVRRTHTQMIS